MLRITGDLPNLLELAELTDSSTQLRERLAYLNEWGEGHGVTVNVDMFIIQVKLDRREADITIRFYDGDAKPAPWNTDTDPVMIGGLNLLRVEEDRFNWSINT